MELRIVLPTFILINRNYSGKKLILIKNHKKTFTNLHFHSNY